MGSSKMKMRLLKAGGLFAALFLVLSLIQADIVLCDEIADINPVRSVSTAGINQAANKITLDIKGMDILDVLKILAMKSRLNIVAGKNVTGRVTIYLKDVDIWDALQIILVSNNLAYEKNGNIVNVMTGRDYELIYGDKFYDKKQSRIVQLKYAKAAEISRLLTQVKTNIGKIIADEASNTIILIDIPGRVSEMEQMISQVDMPTETKIFSLKYAKAEDIEKKIAEMITKNLGNIEIDARTNKILVTDLPKQLQKIEEVITAFDQKDMQVLIEAKILEVTLNDNYKMGIDWDVVAHKYFKLTQNLQLGLSQGGTIKVGTLVGGDSPKLGGEYSGLIEALHEVGELNTLSAPKIMALNNQESKILIGKKEPYSTKSTVSSDQATTTAEAVTYVDLGVKLYVTPTISAPEGFITMKIKPEVSTKSDTYVTGDDNKIPIISTTEAETVIQVKDGATIVIAGLIKDTIEKKVYRIPFLSDIPLLGKIFTNDSNLKKKEEIVIFLTPHIVSGEITFDEVKTWQKREEQMDKIKVEIKQSKKKPPIKNIKIPKKPKQIQNINKVKNQKENKIAKLRQIDSRTAKFDLYARLQAQNTALKNIAFLNDTYSDYFSNIKKEILMQIHGNFRNFELKGHAAALFTLNANGYLRDEPKIIEENNKLIGDILLESIKLAAPFTPFPDFFHAQEEKFTLNVSFE